MQVLKPRLLTFGFLVLIVNSSYLFASQEPTLLFFVNVGLHAVLGLVLAGLAARAWRPAKSSLPRLLAIAAPLLLLAAVSGAGLLVFGATRPYRWLLYAHIAASVAGALPVLLQLLVHAVRHAQPRLRAGVVLVSAGMGLAAIVAIHDRLEGGARYRIVNPLDPPQSMDGEGAGPQSPFFPSSADTNVKGIIPANFFLTSQTCGRCHKDIYEQWRSSMHHFSSFNNQWYRKSIEYMQDVAGTKASKWCAGCHDHAVFFNGRFERPIKEQIDTVEAQAGLACTSCHSIVHVGSTMGQGDFVIEYPPLHDLAVNDNPVLSWTHDYLLRLAPKPHRDTFLKSFHRQQTPEFCSSCHKVHLDVPVNDYRWFRGFNEYDNWQASGVSGLGARSFYYPAKPQKCAECHMPLVPSNDPAAKDGKVRSHRFPGANTAVPFVNRDTEQLRLTQQFLQDKQISVDVFGLVRGAELPAEGSQRRIGSDPQLASTFAQGEESGSFGATQAWLGQPLEVIAPLDRVAASVRRGESVRVEVVLRTRKVGHFFPGGTVDAFDVWVELEATDEHGRTVFHSGAVEDDGKGPVEPGAHFYRSLLIDAHGNPINKRNAWAARSVAYVRLVPPGAADTIHYRLHVPEDCGDTITLKAKVNYRKFSWWNTHWAYAGVRDPAQPADVGKDHDDGRWLFSGDTSRVSGQLKAVPDLPITVMASGEASLKVLARNAPLPEEHPLLEAGVRERWNDYGIGLLLQGDLKAAEAAFLKVTAMDPGYADGWVNVARSRIQEGNMTGAEEMLRKALERDGQLAKTHFFLAMALKPMGRYDEALEHLRQAAALYPFDRVVRNQTGRLLFLKRQYREAIVEFQKALGIDPEDLQAHYNLMLCWQGLGDAAKAQREQQLYQRFKADESAQSITGPYRKLHPEDNNERQAIHEHVGIALAGRGASKYASRAQARAGAGR